jgi:membrane protease YdiL (CAAX protease family)
MPPSSSVSTGSSSTSVSPVHVLALSLLWWGAFVAGRVVGHVSAVLGVLALAILFLPLRDRRLRARCFAGTARELAVDVVAGAIVGVASIALTHAAYPVAVAAAPALATEVARLYVLAGLGLSTLPATLVVIVAEEVLWRAAGPAALAVRGAHPVVAAGSSTALYAAAQSGSGSVWLVAAAFGLGAVWATLAVTRGGRIVAPLVAHALWTLVVLGAWPLVP